MKKFLFNINSTSWFHRLKNGKLVKLEVYLLMICGTVILGATGAIYDYVSGSSFSLFYTLSVMPFCAFILQYVLYSAFGGTASKAIQDHFWKTQLWRFKDPSWTGKYDYKDWEYREKVLERMWIVDTGETWIETLSNSPWIQKHRAILLVGPALAMCSISYLIFKLFW